MTPARPSVVFLSLDTLAAQNTSLHGYGRRTTPHLEALAREAFVFERCLTNASFTSPSYASQLTGLSPLCFYDESQSGERRVYVPRACHTLAERFAEAGYRTGAFVDNPNLGLHLGLDQGFEVYDVEATRRPLADTEGGGKLVFARALAWLDALPPERPFFLFLNLLDAHGPYTPRPEFVDRFAADGLAGPDLNLPVSEENLCSFRAIPAWAARSLVGKGELPAQASTAAIRQRYDESVLALDALCGVFFDDLRARGLFRDVLLIVSADHGESTGRTDFTFGHGMNTETELHVPLLLKLPGDAPPERIDAPVQLLDLFPTIVELAGLEQVPELGGRSLAPLLGDGFLAPVATTHLGGFLGARAITAGEWRLVETRPTLARPGLMLTHEHGRRWLTEHHPELGDWVPRTPSARRRRADVDIPAVIAEARGALAGSFFTLHHLPSDPEERVDLASAKPEIVTRLRRELEQECATSAARRTLLPVDESRAAGPEAELLEELGYAGDEGDD